MEDLCTGCLCSGRKLVFIGETGFYQLYSQIINEIPMHTVAELCVRLCWECCALLQKFQKFKAQVKKNYTDLLWNIPSPCIAARLTTNEVHNISYTEELAPCIKDSQVKDELIIEDIKTEDDDVEHQEPEAFVNDLSVENDDDKPTKKSKKKPKQKKPIKNKINVKKKRKFKAPKNQSTIPPLPEPNQSDGVSDTELGMLLEDDFQEVEDRAEEKVKEDVNLKKLEVQVSDAVEITRTESVKANGHLPPARVPKPTAEPLPDKPQCAECGKTFSSRKTYRYHLNVLHKGNNRYPCPRCGKIYQWKSNLGRHMRSHKAVDADELYCELCEKRFASVATYRQHLRISRMHVTENEFNYTCNECGKKFVNKTRLRDHIDWEHLKKIKFRCQLCNKPFKCHTSLYVHLQNVHRNKEKKDNLCHVCGKSYQNAAKLKYHITALHTGETPYRCSQCAAAFGWYSSLYRHVREVHYKVKSQPKKTKKSKKLEIDPPGYMNYPV